MKFIGYFETRIDGDLVDDWKEWTEATSKEEARNYFEHKCPKGSEVVYIRTEQKK